MSWRVAVGWLDVYPILSHNMECRKLTLDVNTERLLSKRFGSIVEV